MVGMAGDSHSVRLSQCWHHRPPFVPRTGWRSDLHPKLLAFLSLSPLSFSFQTKGGSFHVGRSIFFSPSVMYGYKYSLPTQFVIFISSL